MTISSNLLLKTPGGQYFKAGVTFGKPILKICKDRQRTNTKLLYIIAQRLNVPFQNTNTFVQVYRWHACNFKEVAAASSQLMCQHKAASLREEECVSGRKKVRKWGGSLAPVAGQM